MSLNLELSSKIYKIHWPDDLNEINITQNEKFLLEKRIIKLIPNLPDKENYDSTIHSPKSNSCPRRLMITKKHWFVILNNKNTLLENQRNQCERITNVWDCKNGETWHRKALLSDKQKNCLSYLIYSPNSGLSFYGLPKMQIDTKISDKFCYFEEKATQTLSGWLQAKPMIKIKSIVGLVDAVGKIHQSFYEPSKFYCLNSPEMTTRFSSPHRLFHGNISPNSIYCVSDEEINTRLILSDFYRIGDLSNISWSRGWASPEAISFLYLKEYKEMDSDEFMVNFGAKKDSWALGLIVGSLILKNINIIYGIPFPPFKFITEKIKFDLQKKIIDETEIANITQEEINREIEYLIESEENYNARILWGFVKKLLIVNPDERPTVSTTDFFNFPSSTEEI